MRPTCALSFILAIGASADGPKPGQVWYDCSAEEGITTPLMTFKNVSSDPPCIVRGGHQTIYKTITSHANHTIANLSVLFHQYYAFHEAGPWHTFLKLTVDECKEHPVYCPLVPEKPVEGITVHPPLNPLTPGGWYRSRQLYSDPVTKEKLGCVDMTYRYEYFPSATDGCGKSPSPGPHGYQCSVCGHVYNAAADGNGKPFESLPDTWKCPVCGHPKSAYKKMMVDGKEEWVHGDVATAGAPQYKCSVCNHVYDATKDGNGKPFESLPDTWKCPVCGAAKSAYKKVTVNGKDEWVHGDVVV